MALTLKRLLCYVILVAGLLLLGNVLLLSVDRKPPVDESQLLHQLGKMSDQAKNQAKKEAELKRLLSNIKDSMSVQKENAEQSVEANSMEGTEIPIIVPQEDVGNGAEDVGANIIAAQTGELVLPILVFSCNRAEAISKALDDLIRYRPSKEKFPIIVSQDCAHKPTSDAIQGYSDRIFRHIKQPDQSPIPNLEKKEKKLEGYFKISRHYRWALGQVFDEMKYKAVVVMEDDLNISPDFYEYFESTYHLLREDPTLYCISAWNDNGKTKHVEDKPELLYRSDFFPGLGWMMLDSLWDEYRETWPKGFWDDWFRQQSQRRDRSCLRPEISRTHTFGEKGVSHGLFYKTHLKFIVLNEKKVEWTKMDLSYLIKNKYDEIFLKEVQESPLIPLNQLEQVTRDKVHHAVRIGYTDKGSFKSLAKYLDIMNDFKDGVPRTAYLGIVTIFRNGVRIYITPHEGWTKYDPTWT